MEAKAEKVIPADLPAGAPRNEAKARVKDELEEQAERQAGSMMGFDPSKIEPENEIAQHFNQYLNTFEVTDALPDYCYLWCRDEHTAITEALSRAQRYLGNRARGYKVVSGPRETHPECWHLRDTEGYRRIGDVILLRVHKDVWEGIRRKQEQVNRLRQSGGGMIHNLANRYRRYTKVREFEGVDPKEFYKARVQAGGNDDAVMDALQHETMERIGKDARTGQIVGVPLERAIGRK